jgi:hypothetical protein
MSLVTSALRPACFRCCCRARQGSSRSSRHYHGRGRLDRCADYAPAAVSPWTDRTWSEGRRVFIRNGGPKGSEPGCSDTRCSPRLPD